MARISKKVTTNLNYELAHKLHNASKSSGKKRETIVKRALWFYFAAKEHAIPMGEDNEPCVAVLNKDGSKVHYGMPY